MFIYIAGIGNSGADHWQRRWHERTPGATWVEHESWDRPSRQEWVRDIAQAIDRSSDGVIIVAHSLGCLAALEWARQLGSPKLAGAFLVSVPDPAGPEFPAEARGFSDLRLAVVQIPTIVVSSSNDPYGSSAFHASVGTAIGAELVDVGERGHINTASGLGDWDEGWAILERSLLAGRS
ncbi:MAG TPA: alpha/beta hydrolase [Galbitalea sp.]